MTRPTEAMERLRRVAAGMSAEEAREMCASDKRWRGPDEDRRVVADYLLSRLPRERPEAIAFDLETCEVWAIHNGRVRHARTGWAHGPWLSFNEIEGVAAPDVEIYETESDATLALICQHFDAIDALVERLGEIEAAKQ